MKSHDVLEKLEQWSDYEDGEGSTVDEIVTAVKATKKIRAVIFALNNEIITDEDSGDEENVQRCNLPRNQIIADATVAAAFTSIPAETGQRKIKKLRN